jgi:para-nitrobenzyl esterase
MTASTSPVVRTNAGAVRGRIEDSVAVFRGIPFAAPPVGALRFQAPQPSPRWDGIREADVFGPPPPQSAMRQPVAAQTERTGPVRHDPTDWLTLNVWTPDPGAAGLPVMVWIYGGAYRTGFSGQPDYDGRALARDGVVVVTANHRIGVDGYALLEGAPANRALLDQIATLRWVRDEIAAFGGDPSRVTVFGESAGAGAIAALLVTPAAAGLFARAIAQSVPGTFFTRELAADVSLELATTLNLKPTAAALADVAPERLHEALTDLDRRTPSMRRWGLISHTPTPFSPVVDGEVLPTDPWTGLASGAARDVSLLAGHNRDEWRLFLVLANRSGAVTREMATTAMEVFGPGPDAEHRMRDAYPDASDEELYVLVRSDRMFRIPSLRVATAHIAGGGRGHVYELTWPAPAAAVLGACHGLDIPLVFSTFGEGLSGLLVGSPPSEEALEISSQMRSAWTAFARDGDPGWPAYDDSARSTRVFDIGERGGIMAYPEETSRRLWDDVHIGLIDLE